MSWTVDIPKDVLPDLPPLPDGLQQRFEDVIARDAKQQPIWDTKTAENVRKILESVPPIVVAPEVRELKSCLPTLPMARPFYSKAGTALRLLSPTRSLIFVPTLRHFCRWQWCLLTALPLRSSRWLVSQDSTLNPVPLTSMKTACPTTVGTS